MKNRNTTLILLCCQLLLILLCLNVTQAPSADVTIKKPAKQLMESSIYRTIENAKTYILKHQNRDGGWPLLPGEKSDTEVTALAIWA